MAKVSFSKIKLPKEDNTIIIKYGDLDIEVLKYIPINTKLEIIGNAISDARDENKFFNPGKLNVCLVVELVMAITNLNFTDKQSGLENFIKIYDTLVQSGILDQIISALDGQYEELRFYMNDTVKAIYDYNNSALGILDAINTDYSNLKLDSEEIRKNLSEGKNIELVKTIVDKLG